MRIIRYLLMAILLAMVTHITYAQQFTSASKISTSGTYTAVESKYDNSGNLIIAGYFTGSLTIGGKSITSAGKQDVFIACFNTSMSCYQLLQFGGSGDEFVSALATDASNNIYFAGLGNTGSKIGTYTFSSTNPGIYVAKLNSSGTVQYVTPYLTNGTDVASVLTCGSSPGCSISATNSSTYVNTIVVTDISVDGNGNTYLAGTFTGSLTEVGNGAYTTSTGTATCFSGGGCPTRTKTFTDFLYAYNTAFSGKINSSGTKVWTKKYGAALSDNTSGNTITASNKAVYFSYYDNKTSGTPKTEILRLNTGTGGSMFNKSFTSTYITDGAINSKSNFIFTGYYIGRSGAFYTFNNATTFRGKSTFLHQFDSSGNTLNSLPLYSNASDNNNLLYVDAKDNIYLSGATYDQVYITKALKSKGGLNQFVLRFNSSFVPSMQTIAGGVAGTSVSPLAISLVNKKVNLLVNAVGSVNFDTVKVNAGTGALYAVQLDTTIYKAPTPASDSLVAGEYFFNTDPGIGSGKSFTFTPKADTVSLKLKADISSLPNGFNSLFVRFKSKSGLWSHYEARVFYKRGNKIESRAGDTLVKAEYFIDSDPGIGKGTAISFTAAKDSISLSSKININALSDGFHNLFVRVQNKAGLWSHYEGRVFYKRGSKLESRAGDTLVKAEYFIDSDPGLGKGTAITFTAAKDSINLSGTININSLSNGFHNLFVRVQNKAGLWSHYEGRVFYKRGNTIVSASAPKIVDAEYFFNTDPGIGNGTKVSPSFTAADVIDITRLASISGLPAGKNMFYVRVKDSLGKWSLTEGKSFIICSSVLDKPTLSGKTNYCLGDTIKLSANTVSGASSYFWKGPDNFTSTNQNITIPNITASKTGEYTLVAIRTGGTACDTSNNASITVSLNAPVTPQGLSVNGNTSFCPGDSIVLSTKYVAGYHYRWLVDGKNTANASDTSNSLIVKTAGKYNVLVTNTSGCYSLMRDTIINVFTKPVVSAISGKGNVLTGSTETYSVTQTTGSTYSWFVKNASISSGNGSNSISVLWQNTQATGSIQVVETNANGCKSDTQTLNVVIDSISIDANPTNLSYSASGETKQITITSNTSWTATTNAPSWVTVGTTSGTGNKTVDITVSANPNGTPRNASVTFTAGTVSVVVNIIQDSAYLSVSQTSLSYIAAGETKQVAVTSNFSWTATTNAPSWVTVGTSSGTGNKTVDITVSANPNGSSRNATVTFTAGTVTSVVNITQDSAYLSVSPKSLNYVAAGETKQVSVTSNIKWNATADQSWITVSPSSGTGNASPDITLSSNTNQSTRSGTVTFTAGSLTEVVNITQDFTSGMAEFDATSGLKIFPNPSTGLFTIENNFERMANVKVYDATGRIVNTFKMLPTVTTQLDYKHFSPGVYMLNIVTDSGIITQRLVITK